ncbi:MAG: replicative DNA helicase [bacterium]|nr:replicative DNA helicase [bacterium]MDZ4248201.1 replicative DNA helicase [Patescibacteria group bacterium]
MTGTAVPPQNLEAESSVLGGILLDHSLLERIVDQLTPGDFYRQAHAQIYEAMLALFSDGEPVDALTVANKLEGQKRLAAIGGAAYLAELSGSVPTTANFQHYAQIVSKKATLRRLLAASRQISDLAMAEGDDVTSVVDQAEKHLFSVAQHFNTQAFEPLKDVLSASFDRIDELHKNKGKLRGVPTGFASLDAKLAGLQSSDLVVLAARPSMGKTALALNIARNAAVKSRVSVGIFSLEMSKEQLVDRLLVLEAGVDAWKLRTGHLAERDFPKLATAMDSLASAKLYVDDDAQLTVMEMRARARRLQAEQGLDLLIVDYLQLMDGSPKYRGSDNRVQEISEISRALKGLARELKIPVLALSQLSREVEKRPGNVPQLADLRESGSIEQDADVVMFIYRDDMYRKDSERPNIADILIKKHRNGPTGQCELFFSGDRQKFTDLEKHANAGPAPGDGPEQGSPPNAMDPS